MINALKAIGQAKTPVAEGVDVGAQPNVS
jgi:hypothetical protein